MSIKSVQMKAETLRKKGLVENKDFRIIYFNESAELKIYNFSKLVK